MAAALVDRPYNGQPGTVCSACGVDINKLSVHLCNTCSNCQKKFCVSCYKLKQKLEESSAVKSSDRNCLACDQLIAIKKSEHGGVQNEPKGDQQRQVYPVKPPRGLHDINNLRTHGEEGGGGMYSPQDSRLFEENNYEYVNMNSNEAQNKKRMNLSGSSQLKRKINRFGLYSVSDIPYSEDNRKKQEENAAEYRKNKTDATNFGRNKQQKGLPSSDRKFKTSTRKTGDYNDWDEEIEERKQNSVLKNFQAFCNQNNPENDEAMMKQRRFVKNERFPPQSEMHYFGPEEYQHSESPHHFRENPVVRSENSSDKFPENRQFHNETIHYPNSTNDYSNRGKRQFTYSDNTFNDSNSSDYPVGQGSDYRQPERRLHERSQSTERRSFPSTWHDGFYDEDDFEDLEDIPSYDEIPYALIITGNIDKKMLRKSLKKQQQLDALKEITEKSGKRTNEKGTPKNKNQGPVTTRINETWTESKEQVSASRKLNDFGDIQTGDDRNDFIHPELHNIDNMESRKPANGNIKNKKDESACDSLVNGENAPGCQLPPENMKNKSNDSNKVESVGTVTGLNYEKGRENESFIHSEKELSNSANKMTRTSYFESSIDKSSPVSNEFGNLVQRNDEEKVLAKNEGGKSTKEETRTIESEREIIREMRLKNIVAKQRNITDTVSNGTHIQKNRDLSFNPDMMHKPVKSKAFRSKIPNFTSDQSTLGEVAGYNHENAVDKQISSRLNTKIKSQQSSDDNGDKKAAKTKNLEHEKEKVLTRKLNDELEKPETKSNTKCNGMDEPFSKETNTKSSETKIGNEGGEDAPVAMKLLRGQHGLKKPSMYVSSHSQESEEKYEEMVEPSAMRLLRRSREAKNKRGKVEEALKQVKTGSKSNNSDVLPLIATLFGTMLGGSSSSIPKESSPKITELESSSTNSNPVKPNKNKNVKPVLKKDKEESPTKKSETEDKEHGQILVIGFTKHRNEEEGLNSKEEGTETYPFKSVAIFSFADNRHKAFQKIKMSQSEERLKCTACGRPECQGFNIKKMKEIIRIAKQAGFEVRDVIPDGNCMFAAVVDQLQLYGDYNYGPKSLREAAVTWLIEHPYSDDGTHFSSFLAEDWDVYLQRMMSEGEWGDHLILRAIVETIGHTIKVLNVSGEESHWTILEPATIDVSKDGMHLVLGHVGEFHYTSLRPAEEESRAFVQVPMSPTSEKFVSDDNGQMALEGTETIDMFREDYIDIWSDMPSAHFSYLLKRIIPIKILDTAAVISSQYMDKLSDGMGMLFLDGYDTETEYAGSIVEGSYVPYLNTTINTDSSTYDKIGLEMYAVLKDYIIIPHKSDEINDNNKYICEIEATGVHVGYTKLLRHLNVSDAQHGYSKYVPRLNLVESQTPSNDNKCLAIRCPIWPECANTWVSRVRREGWPSKDIIESIASDGCLIIPNAHKDSKCPNIEWQFWFAFSEKKLFRDGLSLYQKYGYIIFSAFCTQTMRHCKSITSTHLKSVFFYACERIPTEFWESCPGACVLYMLDELLRYVKTKHLPNYFVSSQNMIDHLVDRDLLEIEEQIVLLRSQPVLFLRQINESLRESPCGNSIIDKVSDDFVRFKEHRSLKMSTLEVFIPATIDTAHRFIRNRCFEDGFDYLSQAFQERLSVSTCDDSVPFQMFLSGAVSGLDLDTLVWFSAYTDRQLEGQMSKSLVRETCGDLHLVKIKDILPASVVGSYGDTEVPYEFARNLCTFCHDFAKFLFKTNKLSEILPILYHCHDTFVKKTEAMKNVQVTDWKNSREDLNTDDFTDEPMFNIYTAMFMVYKKQHQVEFFRAVMPVVQAIVERIHTRWAYSCLCCIYTALGDSAKCKANANIYRQLPEDPLEDPRVAAFLHWPSQVYTLK
ncbi:uncharacterized protein LOC132723846 [Ruditapes philippinarum]|uniref:uncharacterized protein LOC132723846 n=1 Tax=Ruditapes philippinarum TaxID=129788 RepID=UPI00295BD847|nr:uncharacterized protein LOC132723846 [Ruditapes philippinarum]XP_060564627.1 uncharacterized protein LOC132723846 [Ruditapes philippinarum]XP_060564628.1 uncharacterized protein LOC132723846 [Ruditapes philippinarum]